MTDILESAATGGTPGLTPPQALDAERAVLAAMLLGNDSVGRALEALDENVFYRVAHRKIFEAIKALYTEREHGLPPGREVVLTPIVGPRSVLVIEGRDHLAHRKLMLPPFHGERMLAYGETMRAITADVASNPA